MMFRPLNSEMARTTVRTSAPSTSRLNVSVPVRTRPTRSLALGSSSAETGFTLSSARHTPTIVKRPDRTLPVRIAVSLSRQRNGNRFRLTIHCEFDDHCIPLKRLDDAVHHFVARTEHAAGAAAVLDEGELVTGAPHDADDLESADVRRG